MDEIKMQGLLNEVFHINNKYEEIAKITGENFNVFDILGRSKHENSFSSFIAEMLNPEGAHGRKDIFLKLFYKHVIGDKILNLDTNIRVNTEFFIGFEEEDYEQSDDELRFSGRIDILIQHKTLTSLIIIENKIYAPDRKKQLLRYWNFGKSRTNEFGLFYLTLDGDKATPISAVHLKPNNSDENQGACYICISYKDHILKWMEESIKETHNFPIVRETLRQYIFLIRKLTNQSKTQEMSEEIQKLITKDSKSFMSASLIAGEFEKTKSLILDIFWQRIIKEIKTKFALDVKIDFKKENYDLLNSWCPSIFIPTKKNNVFIGIEPLNGKHFKSSFNKLFIGIFDPAGENNQGNPFKQWGQTRTTGYDFSSDDILSKIIDPKESEAIKLDILEKVQELMYTLKKLEEK